MTLTPLTSHKDWKKIKKLYKTAFPRYERKPIFIIKHTYKKGSTDVWIIEENSDFLGFMITLNTEELILLDYFAVVPEMRGKGVGTEALKILQEKYSNKKLFLETESVYTEAPNIEERKKRKRFYLNNGMTETGIIVSLFGTDMEVLSFGCELSFEEYSLIYSSNYGISALRNVIRTSVVTEIEDFEQPREP